MEKEFQELKELVKNIYHYMDISDLEKGLNKISEIERKAITLENSLAYSKSENRRYKKSLEKIKQILK